MSNLKTDPILTCEESLAFEKKYFDGDEDLEWQAMNKAGEGVGMPCFEICVNCEQSHIVQEY